MTRKAHAYCVVKVISTLLRSHRHRDITIALHTSRIVSYYQSNFLNEMSYCLEKKLTIAHWKNAFSELVGTVIFLLKTET